ncbi:unnamed protein product [Rotaria sp. Silwood2]|nr:unnamed protein product [Rotaria sp. Silwood2]CAF4269835.1 unnamed protein product [Rotaria sp. Silwood2]
MSQLRPNAELAEFSGRGIEYLIEINEKEFIPWTSIAIICALASVQMAVGGLLIASGFGANLGMSLVTEGGSDLFIAYRVYSTRQFSWSDFAKQKAVSLIISIASMGLSSLKDAAKGAQNLVVGVGEEILEQASTRVITNGRSVYQTLNVARKNLNSLAVKHIAVTIQKNIIREGLNNLNEIMKLVSDMITEQIFRITESQLILPLSGYAIGNLTNIFSETVEHYLVVDEKQNSSSQNREENSRTYNTIREKIEQNAKDYTIAYSQCEIIHYTKQRDEINSQKFDEKISD